MSFEFFDGSNAQTTSPRISIRRNGLIGLNSAAVKMLGEDVTYVQIGFDTERNAIGIRKADEDTPGKYKLRAQQKGTSRSVNGRRLLTHYQIDFETSRSFEVKDFGGGLIGFILNGSSDEEPAAEAPAVKAKSRPKSKAA